MGDQEIVPRTRAIEGEVVSSEEIEIRKIFEAMQTLESAILDYPETGRTIGGKLELSAGELSLKSNGLAVDGKTIIGRSKSKQGVESVQLHAMPDTVQGVGSNLISFSTDFIGIPNSESVVKNPRYMLKIYRHMESESLKAAQHMIANGLGTNDRLFTTYLITDGKIGKFVHLPPYTPDNRPILNSDSAGKTVEGEYQATDQQVILDTVQMLLQRFDLSPPARQLNTTNEEDIIEL